MSHNHSAAFLQLVDAAKSRIKEISIDEVAGLQANQDNFVLIDIREPQEWAAGHIPGALYLSKGLLERDIEACVPDKDKKIVLYCGGGFRSALSADNLQQMGYQNVYSMAGGIREWLQSGKDIAG